MNELRAGQNETAYLYANLLSEDGQESRPSASGSAFWCKRLERSKVSLAFREGLQGKTFSTVLASTNISKLTGIENGGTILYGKRLCGILYSELSPNGQVYTIALE